MSYSEHQLTVLAKDNPKELVRILTRPNNDIHIMACGAEILGNEVADESLVIPALRQLLKHINAIVREGAIIGISAFFSSSSPPADIVERLQKISQNDPSPTCKDLAASILADLAK